MADGIPFTQYQPPQQSQANPLQMAGQMQEMAARAQNMQLQDQQMKAKMAVGRHMQMAIDPATGEMDKYKFLTNLASDPEGRFGFQDAFHMLLENKEIEARTLGQHFQNQQARMNAMSDMMAPMQRMLAEGKEIPEGAIAGMVAQGVSTGYLKTQ